MKITRLAALGAALLVTAGLALALRGSARMPLRSPARPATPVIEPSDGESTIQRALRLAAIDSTKKSAWVDSVAGVDLARLSTPKREVFLRFANAERCTCGCGFTLAACRQFDTSCEVSLPRVTALYDSVEAGRLVRTAGLRPRPPGTALPAASR